MWSVGIGHVNKIGDKLNIETVISHEYVKKTFGIDFIADPFLIKQDGKYYLFVEAAVKNFGRIDVFSSNNVKDWHYEGIAIQETTHMSYPQVFKYNDSMFMIPETKEGGRVSLYEAVDFPMKWKRRRDLLSYGLLDTTILFHEDKTYLFGVTGQYELRCYYTNDILNEEFKEHPLSPLGIGEKMRPAGTPFVKDSNIVIPVQTRKKGYGYSVYSLIVSELTPDIIVYRKGALILNPIKNQPFFNSGVHTVSYLPNDGGFLFAVDGRTGTTPAYWRNYSKRAFENMKNDIKTFFTIRSNNKKSIK